MMNSVVQGLPPSSSSSTSQTSQTPPVSQTKFRCWATGKDVPGLRYVCNWCPDVVLSPFAYANGLFPHGMERDDFSRTEGFGQKAGHGVVIKSVGDVHLLGGGIPGSIGSIQTTTSRTMTMTGGGGGGGVGSHSSHSHPHQHHSRGDGGWTPEETLLLLEAIEKYCDDWDKIADHVGKHRNALDCLMKFVRIPTQVI